MYTQNSLSSCKENVSIISLGAMSSGDNKCMPYRIYLTNLINYLEKACCVAILTIKIEVVAFVRKNTIMCAVPEEVFLLLKLFAYRWTTVNDGIDDAH